MKILVLVMVVLTTASAAYLPWSHHYPVIGPGGHPVETPEVQAAKAHHLAAHSEALARTGQFTHVGPIAHGLIYHTPLHNSLPLDTPEVAAAKLQHHHDYAIAAQRNGVQVAGYGVQPGVPVDTPEVQHAKAIHFAAHAATRGLLHRKRRSIYPQHIPVIGPHGVPIDTPEVQAARAHHLSALNAAKSGHVGIIPHLQTSGHYGYLGYHGPHAVIGHDGHPIETPEVQHAKAAHFAAHAAVGHHYY